MSYIIGDEQRGRPTEKGVYVVLFEKRIFSKQVEEWVYFDGRSVSNGAPTRWHLFQNVKVGVDLEKHQISRRGIIYHRQVSGVSDAILKALQDAGGIAKAAAVESQGK